MPAPPPHQQHQQQQGLPPLQQQQVAAVAAAAAAGVSANTLLVSPRQQGNPILKHIKMVRWQFRDITADYQMGPDAAAVFLSIRCVACTRVEGMDSQVRRQTLFTLDVRVPHPHPRPPPTAPPPRYHLLHPNYVLPRLKALSRGFRLLVLLVHVDSEEAVKPLRELTRIAVGLDATLVCGFSTEVGGWL
jgi:DNA excision repair protein ERCC-1